MDIQFQTPWLLYLTWVAPALTALWIMQQRRARRALDAFASPAMQSRLLPARNAVRQYWQSALAGAGSLLLLLAAAGPRWGERDETVLHHSRDLVIAIDVSFSMLANDVHPSRLERAKVDAMDLIASLKGDRAALIAFRHKPALVCPLTTDYAFLRQALAGIGPDSAPRGETDIGGAIVRALEAFSQTEAAHKAVLLISDGEDLGGQALEAAENAGKRGIPIYTIGIGGRAGSTIPDPRNPGDVLRFEGKPVVTRLEDEALLAIARKSGGSYIPVETAGIAGTTLGTIYSDHLRNVSRRELAESRRRRAVERYQWFLLPAFVLLAAACALSRGRLAAARRASSPGAVSRAATAAVLLALLPAMAIADTGAPPSAPEAPAPSAGHTNETSRLAGHAAARKAQRLYRKGDFENAAALYRRAASDSQRDVARNYIYNEGVAKAAAGHYSEAAEIFRSLTLQQRRGDPDAAPALGATLYQAAEQADADAADGAAARADALRQAGEAFKEAWRADPGQTDARHNLALTLKQLPPAQENALALRLAEKYGDTPAAAMAAEMLLDQRAISAGILQSATNRIPERITAFEDLSRRQKENAERWMPLRTKLAEALAQQPAQDEDSQRAIQALYALMDVSRDNMNDSHHRLRDVDSESFRWAKMAEQGVYQLWKAVAPYEMLLGENIAQQTNAIGRTSGDQPQDPVMTASELQLESAALTDLFRARFEQAVPPEGTVPQDDGGAESGNGSDAPAEGISPEARQRILDLAAETADLQRAAAGHISGNAIAEALEAQRTAHGKLLEIADLLPKPPPSQQQDRQEQQEQQKQEQQPEPSPDSTAQQPEEQPETTEAQDKPEQDQDVQKLLRQALEREREYEEQKRRRQRQIPLPPSARDW